MIHLSVVEDVQDRRPAMFGPVGWKKFVDLMVEQADMVANPLNKVAQPCISPAIYPVNSYRAKAAVTGWDWFAADIDNKAGNRSGATIHDIAVAMDAVGSPYLIYTTASHRPEGECFRLMFPLDRVIGMSEFEAVWRSFALRFGCFDERTKDISRLFIVPRKWEGRANCFFSRVDGRPVCVNDTVRAYPSPVEGLADPVLMKLARETPRGTYVADNLTNLDTSPIVSKRAVEAAMCGAPGGRMFSFLCSVACSARRREIALDAYDLGEIGAQMALQMGRRDNRDLKRDVRNALAFADGQHAVQHVLRLSRLQSLLTGQ